MYYELKVKNDEYDIENTFLLRSWAFGGDEYTYELFWGKIGVGDKMQIIMYTREVNGKVVSRYLNDHFE